MTNDILLEANDISHNFDYDLFKNVSFKIKNHSSLAILGKSGSGKSTLLSILSSLLSPKSGEVNFLGRNLYKIKNKELLKIRREDFGIIFQAHYLFRGFSARENLKISSLLSKKELDYELLEKMDITKVLDLGVGDLSGGQQQRLSVARILSKKPKIIFADEPSGNLDQENSKNLMNILFDYVKYNDAALILVTHENELPNFCDKIYKLENLELKEIK